MNVHMETEIKTNFWVDCHPSESWPFILYETIDARTSKSGLLAHTANLFRGSRNNYEKAS